MSFDTSLYDDLEEEPLISFDLANITKVAAVQEDSGPSSLLPVPNQDSNESKPQLEIKGEESEPEDEYPVQLCKLFVGGLRGETTRESLVEHFQEFGEIRDCVLMMDNVTHRSRGFAFITFASPKPLDKILKMDHVIDGKIVDAKRAVPQEGDGVIAKVFVGGVPTAIDNAGLSEYFSQFGTVLVASLVFDRDTGRSRGFGFVTFEDFSSIDRVLEQQHSSPLHIQGRKIEVKQAQPRSKTNGGVNIVPVVPMDPQPSTLRDDSKISESGDRGNYRDNRDTGRLTSGNGRGRDRDKSRDTEKKSLDKEMDQDRDRDRGRDGEHGNERDRRKDRERERDRNKDKDRERERDRDKGRERERDGGRGRDRDKRDSRDSRRDIRRDRSSSRGGSRRVSAEGGRQNSRERSYDKNGRDQERRDDRRGGNDSRRHERRDIGRRR